MHCLCSALNRFYEMGLKSYFEPWLVLFEHSLILCCGPSALHILGLEHNSTLVMFLIKFVIGLCFSVYVVENDF